MASPEIVEIDGGVLEGGGQILRMATAFSALLKKPIHVSNIRAGRSNPGLKAQHLTGIRLVRDLCHGKLEGDELGSTEITFHPGELREGAYAADTRTAGSVVLLLQVALPCMLFSGGPTRVSLKGGTNAEMAPQIDYMLMIFQPIAQKFGCKFDARIIRRGYYPKGGGEVVTITVPIHQLKPVEMLDPGRVTKITGRAFVAGVLPIKMAHYMMTTATGALRRVYKNVEVKIETVKEPEHKAFGNGSGIIVMAESSTGCLYAGSALGKRGVNAETVGESAANELTSSAQKNGCVDDHLQDQLIIFMALANGKSRIRTGPLTLHTETAIHVAKLLTDATFKVIENSADGSCIIECDGIGLVGNFSPPEPCVCSLPLQNN